MRRMAWAVLIALLGFASTAKAQMGMDLFRQPAIGKVFHPVVGKGAEYLSTSTRAGETKTMSLEMGIVGKDMVDGKEAYWMQFAASGENEQMQTGKALIT